MRGLLVRHSESEWPDRYILLVDGVTFNAQWDRGEEVYVASVFREQLGDYPRVLLLRRKHLCRLQITLSSLMADITQGSAK